MKSWNVWFNAPFEMFVRFCNCQLHSQCLHDSNKRATCCYEQCPFVEGAKRREANDENSNSADATTNTEMDVICSTNPCGYCEHFLTKGNSICLECGEWTKFKGRKLTPVS